MINQVRLMLSIQEFEALVALAGRELRSPADQAHMMLRVDLERCGLLQLQQDQAGHECLTSEEG